jgi:hypothetical protein
MIDLGFIDVSAAVVGSTYQISWSQVRQEPTLVQMERGVTDHIAIYNESGCGFLVTFNQSQGSFTLPAGGWAPEVPVGLPGNPDLSCTLTVQYILPNAGVSQVHSDYFLPGEKSRANSVTLGNSPVNVSGNINLTNVITALLELTGTDTWTIQQDGSGDLLFTDTITGAIFTMTRNGELVLVQNNVGVVLQLQIPSVPLADQAILRAQVTGDSFGRSQLYIRASDGYGGIRGSNGASGQTALYVQANGWQIDKAFVGIGGQATTGSFGMPLVVAQVLRTAITDNLSHPLIAFTPAANGTYRISGSLLAINAATMSATLSWRDPDNGATTTSINLAGVEPSATITAVNALAVAAATPITLFSHTFEASTAIAITFTYQDTHAGPSTVVTAVLERLA